jgi:hypothetical protein
MPTKKAAAVKGTAVTHAVRNVQKEYSSAKKRSTFVAETYCGRHFASYAKPPENHIDCKTCLKALG